MKYIANTSGQLIHLFIGTETITLDARQMVNYYDIVNEDSSSQLYNVPTIQKYIDSGQIVVVSPMKKAPPTEIEIPEVIANFYPYLPLTISQADTPITIENLTTAIENPEWSWGILKNGSAAIVNTDIMYMNGTTDGSENPEIKFLAAGNYTLSLSATDTDTGKIGYQIRSEIITVTSRTCNYGQCSNVISFASSGTGTA